MMETCAASLNTVPFSPADIFSIVFHVVNFSFAVTREHVDHTEAWARSLISSGEID